MQNRESEYERALRDRKIEIAIMDERRRIAGQKDDATLAEMEALRAGRPYSGPRYEEVAPEAGGATAEALASASPPITFRTRGGMEMSGGPFNQPGERVVGIAGLKEAPNYKEGSRPYGTARGGRGPAWGYNEPEPLPPEIRAGGGPMAGAAFATVGGKKFGPTMPAGKFAFTPPGAALAGTTALAKQRGLNDWTDTDSQHLEQRVRAIVGWGKQGNAAKAAMIPQKLDEIAGIVRGEEKYSTTSENTGPGGEKTQAVVEGTRPTMTRPGMPSGQAKRGPGATIPERVAAGKAPPTVESAAEEEAQANVILPQITADGTTEEFNAAAEGFETTMNRLEGNPAEQYRLARIFYQRLAPLQDKISQQTKAQTRLPSSYGWRNLGAVEERDAAFNALVTRVMEILAKSGRAIRGPATR